MPILELAYGGTRTDPSGKSVELPAKDVLLALGPRIKVVIAVQPGSAETLTKEGKVVPKPVSGYALIDTGASMSALDESVCRSLELEECGTAKIGHVGKGDPKERACYPIQLSFPGSPLPSLNLPLVVSCDIDAGQDLLMLLGREVLSNLRMTYNGPRGRIELAF